MVDTDGLAQQEELDDGHCAYCGGPIKEVIEADADADGRVFMYHSFVCSANSKHTFPGVSDGCGGYMALWEGADE